MALIVIVLITALVFEFINGFHDTANSIATVVSTKVLTARQAIFLAVTTNFLGALWGTAVAKTIASGLVDAQIVSSEVIIAALGGAIIWNLITWRFGLPSSSSHALIGGLCGASLAAAHNNWQVIIWSQPSTIHWYESGGILWKVVIPMVVSPVIGFFIGFLWMRFIYQVFARVKPKFINKIFGNAQVFSAASMGFMHGTNDAQKTMGIIALALWSATKAGTFEQLPSYANFLRVATPAAGASIEIAVWIKAVCAITMAAGTSVGGWRIIKTLGNKLVKLQPVNGFAAETSSSIVLWAATQLGIPVSTTHNITASIMGVGAAKRFGSLKLIVVEQIMWAWVFTLPAAGLFGYVLFGCLP